MLDLTLNGSGDSLHAGIEAVAGLCRHSGFDEDRIDEVATALGEALTNAWQYGNSRRDELHIGLKAFRAQDSVIVEVKDSGNGFDVIPPFPDLAKKLAGEERPTGWGVFLMRVLASEVSFFTERGGMHRVRMRFDRARPAEPAPIQISRGESVP